MDLPDYERVIYQLNPLIEVTGQLRFPPILKIAHQEPVEFQDRIRSEYPFFESSQSVGLPGELLNFVQQTGLSLNLRGEQIYNFKSADSKWQLSLTKDSITLATVEYKRYEQFRTKFKEAVDIFEQIYKTPFYRRVGLRYRDLIIRSKLNIKNKEWSELIPDYIASELHTPQLSDSIKIFLKNIQLDTKYGQIQFNHGLVLVQDEQGVQEPAYLFDTDFFKEGGIEDAWSVLDQFKQSAGRLFRWSITDELHRAMQPRPIEVDTEHLSQPYR